MVSKIIVHHVCCTVCVATGDINDPSVRRLFLPTRNGNGPNGGKLPLDITRDLSQKETKNQWLCLYFRFFGSRTRFNERNALTLIRRSNPISPNPTEE